jgi:glycosyltransferase involved in cell wall biosynthesis
MKILYITYGIPDPPHGGALVHDFYLIRQFVQHHQVELFCLLEQPGKANNYIHLPQLQLPAHLFSSTPFGLNLFPNLARHLLARRPLATFPFFSEQLAASLREKIRSESFDIIQIEHSFLAPYIDAIPSDFRGRTVLTFHNIGVEQYHLIAKLNLGWWHRLSFWIKWQSMRGWESRYAERFDHVVTVSAHDAQWLQKKNPRLNVSVIENGVDTLALRPLPEIESEPSLLFVGTMGYPPNVDAMLWFCDEIFPHIVRQVPNVQLTIAGRAPKPAIQKLAQRPHISVTGNVDDLKPYYQRASVIVVPLRAGSGTRLKISEAMAYGRAIVSTTIGCEGLDVQDGENILLADTADEFANRVVQLLRDRARRQWLADNGRRLVEERYDWGLLCNAFLKIYDG